MQNDPIYSFDRKDLKKKMIAHNLTHEKLANEYGSSKQNISIILSRGTAKLSNIKRIEAILHEPLIKKEISTNWRDMERYTPDKKKILFLLVDNDMKRKELANEIGISYNNFCHKLNQPKSMKREEIALLADALGVSFDSVIVKE